MSEALRVPTTPRIESVPEQVRRQRRRRLAAIVGRRDALEANRLITQAHHELGLLLDDVLGPDAGPNFHTWAVWGSREAGKTIGRKDIGGLTAWSGGLGAVIGFTLGLVAGLSPFLVAILTAIPTAGITKLFLDRASRHISHGNRIVLEEIGGATIEFLAALDAGDDDAEQLTARLEPGPTDRGGQDLLRRAFGAYAQARHETDRNRRHQLVFAANCFAVKHEHIRLQHDIASSMPWPLRRIITRRLLDFWVGGEHLHVAVDLEPADVPGQPRTAHPITLAELVVPQAIEAIDELRRPERDDSLATSGAPDWSVFAHRMDYVVDLFRSRHLSPEVFADPYPGTSLRAFDR